MENIGKVDDIAPSPPDPLPRRRQVAPPPPVNANKFLNTAIAIGIVSILVGIGGFLVIHYYENRDTINRDRIAELTQTISDLREAKARLETVNSTCIDEVARIRQSLLTNEKKLEEQSSKYSDCRDELGVANTNYATCRAVKDEIKDNNIVEDTRYCKNIEIHLRIDNETCHIQRSDERLKTKECRKKLNNCEIDKDKCRSDLEKKKLDFTECNASKAAEIESGKKRAKEECKEIRESLNNVSSDLKDVKDQLSSCQKKLESKWL